MSELTLSERPVEKLCELIGLLKEIEKKVVNLEQSLAAAQGDNRKFLSLFSDYEMPCQDFEMAEKIWNLVLSKRNELRDENRKFREQDRRNEVTMGELRRAWEDQNKYIQHLRSRIDNLHGFSPQPSSKAISRDGTVEQVEEKNDSK